MFLAAVFVLAVGVAAVGLGFLPPPFSGTLIRISGGVVEVRKGAVRPNVRQDVGDVLRNAGISQGFIAITAERRLAFSRSIPAGVRQRLRNVLFNQ